MVGFALDELMDDGGSVALQLRIGWINEGFEGASGCGVVVEGYKDSAKVLLSAECLGEGLVDGVKEFPGASGKIEPGHRSDGNSFDDGNFADSCREERIEGAGVDPAAVRGPSSIGRTRATHRLAGSTGWKSPTTRPAGGPLPLRCCRTLPSCAARSFRGRGSSSSGSPFREP